MSERIHSAQDNPLLHPRGLLHGRYEYVLEVSSIVDVVSVPSHLCLPAVGTPEGYGAMVERMAGLI